MNNMTFNNYYPDYDMNCANKDGYMQVENGIRESFKEAIEDDNEPLFTTNAEDLFEVFLYNIPAHARQHYNCNACRNFISRYGGLVTIDDDGYKYPVMWNFSYPEFFNKAIRAVYDAVENAKVTGMFITSNRRLGTPKTGPWTHMAVDMPKHKIYRSRLYDAEQAMAEKKEDHRMLGQAAFKYSLKTIETAVNILRSNSLYRGEKFHGIAEWFLEIKKITKLPKEQFENLLWKKAATAPAGFCHISSSMIGTLLDDIEEGMDFETVKRRFDEKMNPTKYQRPQAAPSAGNVRRAEEIVEKLGIRNSLKRRFAKIDEVETIWRSHSGERNQSISSDSVFAGVKTKQDGKVDYHKGIAPWNQTMTWEKFARTVLPVAKKIEMWIPNRREAYCAFVTADDISAPPIVLWDTEEKRNPVTWYVYANGSMPDIWNLESNHYAEVTGISLSPNLWQSGYEHCGKAVLFILKGCRDTANPSSALFPELLKSELKEVRATIEAYSRIHSLGNSLNATACGIRLQESGARWDYRVKVTTDVGVSTYVLDRWD